MKSDSFAYYREEIVDSIRIEKAFAEVRKYIDSNLATDTLFIKFDYSPDDSSYVFEIDINIGRLFRNNLTYALSHVRTAGVTYIDLYTFSEGKKIKILSRLQGGMTYIRDTIFDVNGDKLDDFLVHWYPSSGCCRRDIYNVYLNLGTESFSSDYEFINPTFSPHERIIRGVLYGHPGEVGLYKYRWNGLSVDTIETIHPDPASRGIFLRSKWMHNGSRESLLKDVPREYHSIESYEWFRNF